MQIRLATKQDAGAISNLIRPLRAKFIAHEYSAEGANNLLNSMTPEAIEGRWDSGFRTHIAEEDGQMVGLVTTRRHQAPLRPLRCRGVSPESPDESLLATGSDEIEGAVKLWTHDQ